VNAIHLVAFVRTGTRLVREIEWLTRQPIHAAIAHIHPDHRASAAVATAAGLTRTTELHDGETRWRNNIDR
jgi:hypothetical protein